MLLSYSYEPLKFLHDRRTIKLVINNKVDIISSWSFNINWRSGSMPHPSIIRLKNEYRKPFRNKTFSRSSIIKRDKKTCQYCGEKLSLNEVTIDHIVPTSKGGKNTFENCVVACRPCNDYKSDYDLDKCSLNLLRQPKNPGNSPIYTLPLNNKLWHNDWNMYL